MVLAIILLSVLLVFLLIFRKAVLLLLTKWKYGKYSFQYQQRFRKYFNSNPHPYCVKDELLQHILHFKKSAIESNIAHFVSPFRGPAFPENKNLKALLKQNGAPSCYNALYDRFFRISLLGYESELFQLACKQVFYFSDKKLFAIDYIFENIASSKLSEMYEYIKNETGIVIGEQKFLTFTLPNQFRLLYTNTGFRVSLKIYKPSIGVFSDVLKKLEQQQQEMKSQIENQYFNPASV